MRMPVFLSNNASGLSAYGRSLSPFLFVLAAGLGVACGEGAAADTAPDAAPPRSDAATDGDASAQDASPGPVDVLVPTPDRGAPALLPTVEDARAVVPGASLPPEVVLQAANNNLDLTDHGGRLFLAFRTAQDHGYVGKKGAM